MASAAFVAASNLGQALGPFLSLPLAYLPELTIAGLPINSVTAIGWIMAASWLTFFLATLLFFKDPPCRATPVGLARESMLLPGAKPRGGSLSQPLLPHAHGEAAAEGEEEEAAVENGQGGKPATRPAGHSRRTTARGWRSTVAATAACTAALFVQKAVQQARALLRRPCCVPPSPAGFIPSPPGPGSRLLRLHTTHCWALCWAWPASYRSATSFCFSHLA